MVQYTITTPDRMFTVADADVAEEYSHRGARVTAEI